MSQSSALILVDERPLRSGLSTDFRRLYKNYCRHLYDLRHHEERVRPAFHRWFHASFHEVMVEVEALQIEVAKKTALLQRMRELCIFDGFSREGAFEQAHVEFEIDEEPDDANEDASCGDEAGDSSESETWIPSRSAFEPKLEETKTARIKSVYRKLAQALHPDLAPRARTRADQAIQLEYWLETQTAYEARDLDQLELLWTMVQITSETQSQDVRVFDLRSALKAMMARLRSAKSEKRHLSKTDPSWKFDKKDRAALSIEIRSEFEEEAQHLRRLLADLDEDLVVFEPRQRQKSFERGQMSFDL